MLVWVTVWVTGCLSYWLFVGVWIAWTDLWSDPLFPLIIHRGDIMLFTFQRIIRGVINIQECNPILVVRPNAIIYPKKKHDMGSLLVKGCWQKRRNVEWLDCGYTKLIPIRKWPGPPQDTSWGDPKVLFTRVRTWREMHPAVILPQRSRWRDKRNGGRRERKGKA
jgi:hypothetical protein